MIDKNTLIKARRKIIDISISISIALAIVAYMHTTGFYYPKIELLVSSNQPDIFRINMGNGKGFRELNSAVKSISANSPTLLSFTLTNTKEIRLDT